MPHALQEGTKQGVERGHETGYDVFGVAAPLCFDSSSPIWARSRMHVCIHIGLRVHVCMILRVCVYVCIYLGLDA